MRLHRIHRPHASRQAGISLIEVVISMTILLMVAATAVGSLRSGVATLGATENSAVAIDAIREFSEFTYGFTVAELDALDDTQVSPVLANGDPFPDAGDLMLSLNVQAVEDLDPETVTTPGASSTRIVTVTATADGQQLLEASWLIAEQ